MFGDREATDQREAAAAFIRDTGKMPMFAPVTGPRLIAPTPEGQQALLGAMMQLCRQNGLSGAHVTFCTEAIAINHQTL